VAKIRLKTFAFLAGYLGSLNLQSRLEVKRHFTSLGTDSDYRGPDAALRKKTRLTQSGKGVNRGGVTTCAQKRHFPFIPDDIRSSWNIAEVSPHMTQRASESLVAVLIRIGLLLALVIMLMAENAQAQPLPHLRQGHPTSLHLRIRTAGTLTNQS
jgi:hypothetical protein